MPISSGSEKIDGLSYAFNSVKVVTGLSLATALTLLAIVPRVYGVNIMGLTEEIRADVMSLFRSKPPVTSTDAGNTGSDDADFDAIEEASDVGPDSDSAMTPDVIEVIPPEPVEILDSMPDEAGQ